MLVTRRYITKGTNFDVVVGIDLHDKKEIGGLRQYLRTRKPACGIISIPCIGQNGGSGSRHISNTLGELGGQVALSC